MMKEPVGQGWRGAHVVVLAVPLTPGCQADERIPNVARRVGDIVSRRRFGFGSWGPAGERSVCEAVGAVLPRVCRQSGSHFGRAPREITMEALKACATDQQKAVAALVAAGTPQDIAAKHIDAVRSRAVVALTAVIVKKRQSVAAQEATRVLPPERETPRSEAPGR